MSAHLPANEEARLAALKRYDILDTPSESEFDDLTLLAAEICGTPIALISLIDSDRQWFKSKRGWEITETSRDYSFCSYALVSGEFLEVPDALEDERFDDNPFVVGEPHIRFYAGGPLTTPEGLILGTLCVVDRVPRQLTACQREALSALSRQVVRQMELRLASREEKRLNGEITKLNSRLKEMVQDRTGRLLESEERHRALTESANDGIVSADAEGRILSWNKAAETIFGYTSEEAVGKFLTSLLSEDFRMSNGTEFEHYVKSVDSNSRGRTVELIGLRKDGHEFPLELSGASWSAKSGKYFSGILRDLTEQKDHEMHRLRTQRLESLGTLSGGVAHDLNNALTPIMMGVELLRMKSTEDNDLLDTIETSARHGAAMVRHLLTFAKGVEGERLLLQPRYLFKELASMIKCAFPKNIEVKSKYESVPLVVSGDATQLHQVFLNLCVNSRDAMPKGGTLTLQVTHRDLQVREPGMPSDVKLGSYVICSVTDTGAGISREVLTRIFEPFFTTKAPDKGTGLGLSTALGIVKSHGGFIQVHSAPGKGTSFHVFLPQADAAAAAETLPVITKTNFRGGGELVLVVDDEPAVRQMIRSVLSSLNYRVLTAGEGTEALIHVVENRGHLRLIITDVHMPLMGGVSFVRILRRITPEAGIIVSSGYLEEKEIQEFADLGARTILNKPFTHEQLAEKLEQALSAG